MKPVVWTAILLAAGGPLRAAELDAQRCQDTSVVQILTDDEDGARRDTSVWIACFDGHGYVRTNDSRWLANIRRGSRVALRIAGDELAIAASEPNDAALAARVEEHFKEKYGFMQRVASALRFREPTVLELTAR